jgi:hypothetical protein
LLVLFLILVHCLQQFRFAKFNTIPSGKNWGGTVVFNGSAAQNAVPGSYSNLTINNGVGVTVTNAAQIAISGTY